MTQQQAPSNAATSALRRDLESFGAGVLAAGTDSDLPHWPEERTQLNYTGASGSELMRRTVDFVEFLGREVPQLSTGNWRGLDYGVGWGRIASLMRFFGSASNLDCADAWQKSIDLARGCGLQNQFKLFPPRLTGGELTSAEYDLIYSYSIFTHLPETHIVDNITHLMTGLKRGGKLVFTLRQSRFIEFLKRSNKFATDIDRLDSDGYWFGNSQTADYGDTVVTDEWITRNLGSLGEIRTLGPLATEPFQSMTVLTKA